MFIMSMMTGRYKPSTASTFYKRPTDFPTQVDTTNMSCHKIKQNQYVGESGVK